MNARVERHGQTEIGIVTGPTGREFSALGASVSGRHVAGYLGKGDTLTTWDGRVMLAGRSYRLGEWRSEDGTTFGMVWLLPRGRAVVGYCLGEGMLVRGELVYSHQDIDRECKAECEYWLERDAEDAEQQRWEDGQDGGGE